MKTFKQTTLLLSMAAATLVSSAVFAGAEDDPLLTNVMLDQLEKGVKPSDPTTLSAQAWVGYDMNKLWFKANGDYKNSNDQSLEVQALFSHAVAAYWNLQVGVRRDIKPSPSRNWAVFGVQGLAPYFFDINSALFVGEEGRTALRLSAEQDLLITQQWILKPEMEINAYGKSDKALSIGSGISDISAGLRLRYEITRKLAPYIGVDWSRKIGQTAQFARDEGSNPTETKWVVGIKAWF